MEKVEIMTALHALRKEQRDYEKQVLAEYRAEHNEKVTALRVACGEFGHEYKYAGHGFGGDYFICRFCGADR